MKENFQTNENTVNFLKRKSFTKGSIMRTRIDKSKGAV